MTMTKGQKISFKGFVISLYFVHILSTNTLLLAYINILIYSMLVLNIVNVVIYKCTVWFSLRLLKCLRSVFKLSV